MKDILTILICIYASSEANLSDSDLEKLKNDFEVTDQKMTVIEFKLAQLEKWKLENNGRLFHYFTLKS